MNMTRTKNVTESYGGSCNDNHTSKIEHCTLKECPGIICIHFIIYNVLFESWSKSQTNIFDISHVQATLLAVEVIEQTHVQDVLKETAKGGATVIVRGNVADAYHQVNNYIIVIFKTFTW